MLGLVPVGSAPIGILSLNIRNVANRDLEVDGWNPSVGTVIADTLDEDTPDNSDYAYSSNLDDRQAPLVMALNNPLEAGTYTFNFTAQKDLEWAQVKLTLLDSNLTSVGSSSWTGLVDRTFNTYSVTATTTGTSAYIKVEARSDAAVVLDFTDQDKTPKGLSIYNSNYFSSFGRNGLYLDKYGYLRNNEINLVNNDTNISSWVNSTTLSSYILNQDYSPDNTYTAAKLVESNSSGVHALTSMPIYSIAIGTTYTRSIYLKPSGRTVCKLEDGLTTAHSAIFVLSGVGSVQSATNLVKSSINSVGNGWYRCSITYTNSGNTETWLKLTLQSSTSVSSYLGDGVSGVFFWGNQLERGWNLTPYTNNPYTEVDHGGGSHRLRIHHDPTDYYYVGNEVEPPRAWLASLAQSGNYLYFTGNVNPNTIVNGNELIIENAGSTNTYYGIQFTRTTTAGLPYSLETGGRKISGGNVFLRIDSPSNNTGTRPSVNSQNITSISVISKSTFRATTGSITYLLYHDGVAGSSSAYTTVSLREIRHRPLGLLVECYTQNELLYSTDLSNTSVWTTNLLNLVTNEPAVSPSGSIDTFLFNAGTSTGGHSLQQNVNFTAGSTYIFSVYCNTQVQLRVDDGVGGFYANFLNLSGTTPTVSGSTAGLTTIMERQGNGWTRVAIKFVATAGGTFPVFINMITGSGAAKNQSFTGTTSIRFKLWGPMLQYANTVDYTRPSSYIPTGATIGANANDFYRYNIGDIYNAGAPFSIYLEAGRFNQTYGYLLSLTAGEGGNFWSIDYTSTNELRLLHYLPSYLYPVLTTTTGSVTPSSVNVIAARFESGNFAVSVNGVLFTSTNTVDPIPGVNLLQLCWMGDNNFGGYIRRVKYYPRALSDGELLTLAGTDPDQNAGVNLLTTSW